MNRALGKEQYANADKFKARIYLNTRFRTNQYPWPAWLFDQLEKQDNYHVLELGCGTGLLWSFNAQRIPVSWEITLSDYSTGMLEETRRNLCGVERNLHYMVIDAEKICLPDASFDIVIANNMLYHVPNRERALSEIRRVLKEGGSFYAATAGVKNLGELRLLLKEFTNHPENDESFQPVVGNFCLENGASQLKDFFRDIEIRRYDDSLEITEADAIVNYFLSFQGMYEGQALFEENRTDEFRRYIADKIAHEGKIAVSKEIGMFIGRK